MKYNNRYNRYQKGMDLKWILPALGVTVLVIGVWIGVSLENRDKSARSAQDPPVVFGIATMDIAREFICPCGSCNQKNLAVCECKTAVSAKRFIETNINNGLEKEEVIDQVKRVYGNYKGS